MLFTMAVSSETPSRSFHPPQEPEWHRMIAEAAYYLAQKRGFHGKHALDDWLAAEQAVRDAISPVVEPEASMSDAIPQNQRNTHAKSLEETDKADTRRADAGRQDRLLQEKRGQNTSQQQSVSRFEKFAATQAAGDGIEGNALKPGKTVDEKLAANMADRK
jgi:hypothetical protein